MINRTSEAIKATLIAGFLIGSVAVQFFLWVVGFAAAAVLWTGARLLIGEPKPINELRRTSAANGREWK